MYRTMLKSKLHRATVTGSDLNYIGSITIDAALLDLANILDNEQVHVVNINNGSRLVTYAIAGDRGSGTVQVNGAGARLVHAGDIVIVMSYAEYDDAELDRHAPTIIDLSSGVNGVWATSSGSPKSSPGRGDVRPD